MTRPKLIQQVARATSELQDESRRAMVLQREARALTARSRELSRQLHAAAQPSRGIAANRSPPPAAHDEQLLDEAQAETFPASAPVSPFCSRLGG